MEGERFLEDLAQTCGCFISSLGNQKNILPTIHKLCHFPVRNYPLAECSYAISYILGREVSFSSYGELEQFLHQEERRLS